MSSGANDLPGICTALNMGESSASPMAISSLRTSSSSLRSTPVAPSPLRVLLVASDTRLPATTGLASRIPRAIEIERIPAAGSAAATARLEPDAVVVDGRLASAIRVVRELRTSTPTVPVLFVADGLDSVAPAICAGATDFVMATASPAETLIRLQFLTTAAGRPLSTTRVIGSLHLDRDARTLSSSGRTVKFTPIELKMFERLLLQPGQPVSRAELERSIWRQDEVDEQPTNIVAVYVAYVRRKLARIGGCSIRTITNVGYALDLTPIERRVAASRRKTS